MSETEVTTDNTDQDNLDDFSTDFFGRKPDVEKTTQTKVEAEQDDQENHEPEETEALTPDDEQDEAELQEEIKEPKRKTVQDRIDEVVRQREELRRESAAEINKLRQELEDFKKSQARAAEQPKEPQEPNHDAVDANGNPVYALGEFDPQYIRDLTRYTLQQEREKVQAEMAESQRQAVAQQEQQALQTKWDGQVTEAAQEYPDFVEKGQALLRNFENLDQSYAGYLSSILMQMDKGTDVLYYLSNNPDEAIKIVNSGAQKATLALGRIEAKFIEADAQKQLAKPKVSKAPPPPTERARGTNGAFVSVAPDTDNQEDFEALFFRKK